uniref:Uncharacterized protein n=1 Tax=Chromera velia CCMP2878 TaxID=1169474 RepID=A0A0G4HFH9_9ALVE|eukprot:Cvel_26951.t1-p1 / transcript=Cvel_26951.t1 / gene=Cvel_26951 / organism=Chromera_velia_CCMP2878 / gene_product=hypothetical protein / transcript_product=hypothetical protein / location=Cvel_scaffold3284:317-4488(-) / protein_length=1320 / sequence_SO=supercontig / SO=protein_coding / is_pseudo=false
MSAVYGSPDLGTQVRMDDQRGEVTGGQETLEAVAAFLDKNKNGVPKGLPLTAQVKKVKNALSQASMSTAISGTLPSLQSDRLSYLDEITRRHPDRSLLPSAFQVGTRNFADLSSRSAQRGTVTGRERLSTASVSAAIAKATGADPQKPQLRAPIHAQNFGLRNLDSPLRRILLELGGTSKERRDEKSPSLSLSYGRRGKTKKMALKSLAGSSSRPSSRVFQQTLRRTLRGGTGFFGKDSGGGSLFASTRCHSQKQKQRQTLLQRLTRQESEASVASFNSVEQAERPLLRQLTPGTVHTLLSSPELPRPPQPATKAHQSRRFVGVHTKGQSDQEGMEEKGKAQESCDGSKAQDGEGKENSKKERPESDPTMRTLETMTESRLRSDLDVLKRAIQEAIDERKLTFSRTPKLPYNFKFLPSVPLRIRKSPDLPGRYDLPEYIHLSNLEAEQVRGKGGDPASARSALPKLEEPDLYAFDSCLSGPSQPKQQKSRGEGGRRIGGREQDRKGGRRGGRRQKKQRFSEMWQEPDGIDYHIRGGEDRNLPTVNVEVDNENTRFGPSRHFQFESCSLALPEFTRSLVLSTLPHYRPTSPSKGNAIRSLQPSIPPATSSAVVGRSFFDTWDRVTAHSHLRKISFLVKTGKSAQEVMEVLKAKNARARRIAEKLKRKSFGGDPFAPPQEEEGGTGRKSSAGRRGSVGGGQQEGEGEHAFFDSNVDVLLHLLVFFSDMQKGLAQLENHLGAFQVDARPFSSGSADSGMDPDEMDAAALEDLPAAVPEGGGSHEGEEEEEGEGALPDKGNGSLWDLDALVRRRKTWRGVPTLNALCAELQKVEERQRVKKEEFQELKDKHKNGQLPSWQKRFLATRAGRLLLKWKPVQPWFARLRRLRGLLRTLRDPMITPQPEGEQIAEELETAEHERQLRKQKVTVGPQRSLPTPQLEKGGSESSEKNRKEKQKENEGETSGSEEEEEDEKTPKGNKDGTTNGERRTTFAPSVDEKEAKDKEASEDLDEETLEGLREQDRRAREAAALFQIQEAQWERLKKAMADSTHSLLDAASKWEAAKMSGVLSPPTHQRDLSTILIPPTPSVHEPSPPLPVHKGLARSATMPFSPGGNAEGLVVSSNSPATFVPSSPNRRAFSMKIAMKRLLAGRVPEIQAFLEPLSQVTEKAKLLGQSADELVEQRIDALTDIVFHQTQLVLMKEEDAKFQRLKKIHESKKRSMALARSRTLGAGMMEEFEIPSLKQKEKSNSKDEGGAKAEGGEDGENEEDEEEEEEEEGERKDVIWLSTLAFRRRRLLVRSALREQIREVVENSTTISALEAGE